MASSGAPRGKRCSRRASSGPNEVRGAVVEDLRPRQDPAVDGRCVPPASQGSEALRRTGSCVVRWCRPLGGTAAGKLGAGGAAIDGPEPNRTEGLFVRRARGRTELGTGAMLARSGPDGSVPVAKGDRIRWITFVSCATLQTTLFATISCFVVLSISFLVSDGPSHPLPPPGRRSGG